MGHATTFDGVFIPMDRIDRMENLLHSVDRRLAVQEVSVNNLVTSVSSLDTHQEKQDNRIAELEGYLKEARGAVRVALPMASIIASALASVISFAAHYIFK